MQLMIGRRRRGRWIPFGIAVLIGIAHPVAAQNAPCEGAAFRAFDFWLGEWTVANAAGTLVGQNSITSGEGGCVLEESWRSASGGTGRSLNFYDPVRGIWRQLWVSAGSIIDIQGGIDATGSMALEGSITYTGNTSRQAFRGRWTPLPDGRVRQFFEQRPESGGEWTPWFEGFYRRVDGGVHDE